jgi:oligopeptidase B
MNMRPELFKLGIAEVPFLDCLTSMSDESLPLTLTDREVDEISHFQLIIIKYL